ncbi:hypothetical protein ACTFIT_003072 [Dictyostelium discoideum]
MTGSFVNDFNFFKNSTGGVGFHFNFDTNSVNKTLKQIDSPNKLYHVKFSKIDDGLFDEVDQHFGFNNKKCEHHGHRTDSLESTSNILSLIILKMITKINETILEQSKDKYNEIQLKFDNNSLKKEIKKIHDIVSIVELDFKKQLEKTFENNTLINTFITSSINNDNEILSTIINNNNNENENENENEN